MEIWSIEQHHFQLSWVTSNPHFNITIIFIVMYNVAEWSRCVWSRRRGDAGGGVLFVTRRAARACVHVAAVSWVLLIDSGRRVWACPYKHVFFWTDSLVVTHVEFPTFLSFESETCRASVIWETRGWHECRILLRQRENYWGSRTVGASCGVTVRDSPWLCCLYRSTVPCQGVAWVQKRSDATQKTSVKTGILWWWTLNVSRAQRR